MGILTPQVYAFDVTGNAPENKVVNEQHTVTPVNTIDLYFIAPRYAPFYKESMVVKYLESGTNKPVELKASVDYLFSYRFLAASLSTTKEIYGGISIINTRLSGVIVLEYQTLGGDWLVDENTYLKIVNDKTHNPIVTYWDEIADIPYRFPVTNHDWNIQDLTGAEDLVAAINAIESSLRDSSQAGLTDHMSDYNNPHRVTKEQVGLGKVENLPLLPANHGSDTSNNYYLTPTRAIDIINYQIADDANEHMDNHNNPHHVTKAQIGLGSVQNLPILPEGNGRDVSDNYYVTPRGVNDIIAGNSGASISAHINDYNNPHHVTKEQVGLGNVENLPILPEGSGGDMSDNYYVTPRAVHDIVSSSTGGSINDHINDYNNPHHVTKAQIGLSNVENYQYANDHFTVSDTSSTKVVTNDGLLDTLENVDIDASTLNGQTYDDINTSLNNNLNTQLDNVNNQIGTLQGDISGILNTQGDSKEITYVSDNNDLNDDVDLANGVLQPIASFTYTQGQVTREQFSIDGIIPSIKLKGDASGVQPRGNLLYTMNLDIYNGAIHPERYVPISLYVCAEIDDFNQESPRFWMMNTTTGVYFNNLIDENSSTLTQSRMYDNDSVKSLLGVKNQVDPAFFDVPGNSSPYPSGFYITTSTNIDFDKTPADDSNNLPTVFVASGFDDIIPTKTFNLYFYQKEVISDLTITTDIDSSNSVVSNFTSLIINTPINFSDIDETYYRIGDADINNNIKLNYAQDSESTALGPIGIYKDNKLNTYNFTGKNMIGFITNITDLYHLNKYNSPSLHRNKNIYMNLKLWSNVSMN